MKSNEVDQRITRMSVRIYRDEVALEKLEGEISELRQQIADNKMMLSLYLGHTDPEVTGDRTLS